MALKVQELKDGNLAGKFVVVRSQTIDANGISGSRSRDANRVRHVTRYWGDYRWMSSPDDALHFETYDDAEVCISDNAEVMANR